MAFLAPSVTIAFLRSRPLPGAANCLPFLDVTANHLLLMWALCYWLRNSWQSAVGVRYITKRFVGAVTRDGELADQDDGPRVLLLRSNCMAAERMCFESLCSY
jgi:hypothetical protein